MPAITLSVPEDLKKRMDSVDWINWSSVARKAFAEKLSDVEDLEARKKVENISEIPEADKRVVKADVARKAVRSLDKAAKEYKEGKLKPMSLKELDDLMGL